MSIGRFYVVEARNRPCYARPVASTQIPSCTFPNVLTYPHNATRDGNKLTNSRLSKLLNEPVYVETSLHRKLYFISKPDLVNPSPGRNFQGSDSRPHSKMIRNPFAPPNDPPLVPTVSRDSHQSGYARLQIRLTHKAHSLRA